jgi:hypothetical protein
MSAVGIWAGSGAQAAKTTINPPIKTENSRFTDTIIYKLLISKTQTQVTFYRPLSKSICSFLELRS